MVRSCLFSWMNSGIDSGIRWFFAGGLVGLIVANRGIDIVVDND